MEKAFNLLLIIAIAFLAFVGGAFVVLTKAFPYEYFNNAYQAMDALYHQSQDYQSPYQTNLWRPTRTDLRGVTLHKPGKVFYGFTLYSSSDAQRAILIDVNGKVARMESPDSEDLGQSRSQAATGGIHLLGVRAYVSQWRSDRAGRRHGRHPLGLWVSENG